MTVRFLAFLASTIAGFTTGMTWGDIPGTVTLVLLIVTVICGLAYTLTFEPVDHE